MDLRFHTGALIGCLLAVLHAPRLCALPEQGAEHRPAPAAAESSPNGWHATYRSAGDSAAPDHEVHTHSAVAAFALDRGETVHPEIGMSDLRARFAADIDVAGAGVYRFGLRVEGGSATLQVVDDADRLLATCRAEEDGDHHGDWVDLPRGRITVAVEFARSGYRRARLQTRWQMRFDPDRGGFPEEPIPTSVARVPESAHTLVSAGLLARRGRVLLERKGCVNCHTSSRRSAAGLLVAPRLDGVAERLSPTWMARWIRRPADLRRGADMPGLLPPGPAGHDEARNIAAFLASLSEPTASPDVLTGRALYHRLGCVACHGATASLAELSGDDFQNAEVPAAAVMPFGDMHGKWLPGALVEFLLDPTANHPAGRMPAFGLDRDEAEPLAAFLRATWAAGEPLEPEVERGREAWAARGCGTCHLLASGRTQLPHREEAGTARRRARARLSRPRGHAQPALRLGAGRA